MILSERAVWITLVIGLTLLIMAGISDIFLLELAAGMISRMEHRCPLRIFISGRKRLVQTFLGQETDAALLQRMHTEM